MNRFPLHIRGSLGASGWEHKRSQVFHFKVSLLNTVISVLEIQANFHFLEGTFKDGDMKQPVIAQTPLQSVKPNTIPERLRREDSEHKVDCANTETRKNLETENVVPQ